MYKMLLSLMLLLVINSYASKGKKLTHSEAVDVCKDSIVSNSFQIVDVLPKDESMVIKIGRKAFDGTNTSLCTQSQVNDEINRYGKELKAAYAINLWAHAPDQESKCFRVTADFYRDRQCIDPPYKELASNVGEGKEAERHPVAFVVSYVIGFAIGFGLMTLILSK